MPARIQLRRSKGWKKPKAAVVVARPSRWGNPFRAGLDGDRAECIELYRRALEHRLLGYGIEDARRQLAGRDLACWCPLDEPCHADLLLEVANDPSIVVASGSEPWAGDTPGRG